MISISHSGSFKHIEKFLSFIKNRNIERTLSHYGDMGVRELQTATPIDSGTTASMWGYEIHSSHGRYEIVFTNDNVNKGVPIAIILQYGHATRNGGYVQGIDYINPALVSVFNEMAEELWKEVETA